MNISLLNKPLSFVKRDFLIDISYRIGFILQFGGIFVSTLMFFFLSRLVGTGMANQMEPYGGNYFSFVLIGIAFEDYLSVSLGSFASQIRSAQVMGTLEALLVTPTSASMLLFSSTLYNFFFTSFRIVLYLFMGIIVFGVTLNVTSLAAFSLIMVLTILSFLGIGLLSAAFIIAFKQGSPVSWVMGSASGLLGGVFYPVSVLPPWLSPFADLLPITHALEAMRRVLLTGASLDAVYNEILILAGFVILLLPSGLLAFGYGLKLARKEGSLIQY
ncbi:MAG: ABC transporter permease [Nitrospirota bacterium]